MTIWQPDLSNLKGPDYQRLADAIRRDIEAGRLQPGDRLPPQRDLADTLAMTLGTVTRAYQNAAKRGLVAGEVGRGTYVLVPPGAEDGEGVLDLSLNAIPPHAYLSELAARLDPPHGARRTAWLEYPPRGGHDDHREAGAEWIARRSVHVSPSQVLITVGAQHGLLIALSAVTSPGDAILVEELTYTGVITAARMLGLKPVPVAIDAEGLRPDSLDTVARTSGARALVIQPSLHNPTGVTMTPGRRREIIHTIHRHGLTVVEDDTYGFLVPDTRPVAADLNVPWIYVTGMSKSLAAGYRTGFLAASPQLVDRAASALWASTLSASPIAVALAVSLIVDGTADRVVEWKRSEARARAAIARELLPQIPQVTAVTSPHVWLPLSLPWRASSFATAARERGILLGAAETFLAQAGASPRAIRICLMPPRTRERLREALTTLAEIASQPPMLEAAI
jgi:DNA-binding transcriptional MocR family regulator